MVGCVVLRHCRQIFNKSFFSSTAMFKLGLSTGAISSLTRGMAVAVKAKLRRSGKHSRSTWISRFAEHVDFPISYSRGVALEEFLWSFFWCSVTTRMSLSARGVSFLISDGVVAVMGDSESVGLWLCGSRHQARHT